MVELVLLIIILEILIRLTTYFKRRKIFFLYENVLFNEKRAAYKSHPNLNYIKSFNVKNPKFPSNSDGFAGTKNYIKSKNIKTHRIITVGGSTVEQNDLDMMKPFNKNLTWPYLLEKKLNKKNKRYQVINAGCAGYTIIETLISLMTKLIFWKPNTIIYLLSINDIITSQIISKFVEDNSHIRKQFSPQLDTKWIPEMRFLFFYQISLKLILNLLNHQNKDLISYFSNLKNWKYDYRYNKDKKNSYENYLNIFCEICKQNRINLILLPIVYNKFAKNLTWFKGTNIKKSQLKKFVKINNGIIKKVQFKYKKVNYIDLDKLQNKHFRKGDFVHFSKEGLEFISEHIAKNWVKNLSNYK